MKLIKFYLMVAGALLTGSNAFAQFDGILILIPEGCESKGQCTLKERLRFTDSSKIVWEASAGLQTDGASIPAIFQTIVGKPFTQSFIKAAVVHDHYCDRHVRPWRQTHKVFYEALIDQGVSKMKAKVMYFAVYLGGPKWVKLMPGKVCGNNCINTFKTPNGSSGVYARKADFSAPDIAAAMKDVTKILETDPDALSLDQLEKKAADLRPSDFFYKHGSDVNADEIGITE